MPSERQNTQSKVEFNSTVQSPPAIDRIRGERHLPAPGRFSSNLRRSLAGRILAFRPTLAMSLIDQICWLAVRRLGGISFALRAALTKR